MKKIMMIFGTRPEAIKMAPLIKAFEKKNQIETIVTVSGQHREMLDQVLSIFNIKPKYNLNIMKKDQTLFDITSNLLLGIKSILEKEKPDLILVHGDTTTTFVAALSAFYLKIPVGHVEAGLRTYDIFSPFPEEFNRRTVSLISKFNFTPTKLSKQNLLNEGVSESNIFVTGNTVIDALKTTVKSDYTHELLEWASGSKLILITAHRRENLGKPMENMFEAIRKLADEFDDVKVIYPIHMNPIIRKIANDKLGGSNKIKIIEPLDVIDFHNFMNKSYLIITDSGGVQEEAPSLGKPVLVMRETTERPEGLDAGTLKLVGTDTNRIYETCKVLLTNSDVYYSMSRATNPYGDGYASERIVDIILRNIDN